MNIVFEGIDGVGKTTLIKSLKKELKSHKVKYIKEIKNSPLEKILKDLLSNDPFFKTHKQFKTSIYETFLLAAGFFYKQEFYKKTKQIKLFDRDLFTLLCSQKFIIKEEYGKKSKKFYKHFKKIMMFELKKIDLLIYIKVPFKISLKRIKKRDKLTLNKSQIYFLKKVKKCFEKKIKKINSKNILILNGEKSVKKNIKIIKEKLCI